MTRKENGSRRCWKSHIVRCGWRFPSRTIIIFKKVLRKKAEGLESVLSRFLVNAWNWESVGSSGSSRALPGLSGSETRTHTRNYNYSVITAFTRLRGWSTLYPLLTATW